MTPSSMTLPRPFGSPVQLPEHFHFMGDDHSVPLLVAQSVDLLTAFWIRLLWVHHSGLKEEGSYDGNSLLSTTEEFGLMA